MFVCKFYVDLQGYSTDVPCMLNLRLARVLLHKLNFKIIRNK